MVHAELPAHSNRRSSLGAENKAGAYSAVRRVTQGYICTAVGRALYVDPKSDFGLTATGLGLQNPNCCIKQSECLRQRQFGLVGHNRHFTAYREYSIAHS